jgi:folylpolyglutamate synthase/dihydropteroate synthase
MGRFELISKEPLVIFDGAHNPSGITALTNSLERYYKDKKKNFIIAFMGDKDIKQILGILKNMNAQKFYFTKVQDNERALSENSLYHIAKEIGIDGEICSDVKSALKKNNIHLQAVPSELESNSTLLSYEKSNNYDNEKNNGEITVICGSLYLYKDLF